MRKGITIDMYPGDAMGSAIGAAAGDALGSIIVHGDKDDNTLVTRMGRLGAVAP